jgi:hypothetical protein
LILFRTYLQIFFSRQCHIHTYLQSTKLTYGMHYPIVRSTLSLLFRIYHRRRSCLVLLSIGLVCRTDKLYREEHERSLRIQRASFYILTENYDMQSEWRSLYILKIAIAFFNSILFIRTNQ